MKKGLPRKGPELIRHGIQNAQRRDPTEVRVYKFSKSHINKPFDEMAYGVPAGSTVLWPKLHSGYEFVKVLNLSLIHI